MVKDPSMKKVRRIKVFTPNSTFTPESASNLSITVEAGKDYPIRGKTNLADQKCWIIVERNSTKYDVLLSSDEARQGVFRTVIASRKK
jgi:hypothetical protein